MGLLSLNLPVIGQSSATEDQKIRDALASLQTGVNGNLDEANVPNLAAAFTTWRTVAWGGGTIPTQGAGGTLLMSGGPGAEAVHAIAAVGAAGGGAWVFYLDPADWTANARTTKLRLRAQCSVNAVAPATNLVPGLYPVNGVSGPSGTAPALTGVGAVVSGSTATFTTPGASTMNQALSTEFNAPAAG